MSSNDPTENINVATIPTPNPNALMFRVDEMLVPHGTYEFNSKKEAAVSPFAEALFGQSGINSVFIAPRFVTIEKHANDLWPDLVPFIKKTIRDLIHLGSVAVLDEGLTVAHQSQNEVEKKIQAILDDDIRPMLARDGGDVTFVGFHDGVVQLQLIGACGNCPSSTTTLQMGISSYLQEEIPEVIGVEQV